MIIFLYLCTVISNNTNIVMQIDIDDEELETLILYGKTDGKKYKRLSKNKTFLRDLNKVISILRTMPCTASLKAFGSLHYENLKHNLSGFSSVRVGYKTKYRLIFEEFENGIIIKLIEINEHYGDK